MRASEGARAGAVQWRARKPGAREEINYEDHNESHKTWREGSREGGFVPEEGSTE